MRNCFVPSCDNVCKDQPRRCMFHPPKNMYEIWKATLPKQKEFKPTDKVCERHFQSNDVIRNFEQIINGEIYRLERGRARLKPNAIPYLNLPSEKELLMKSRKNAKTPSTSVSDTDSPPKRVLSKRKQQLDEKTSDTNDEKTDDDNDASNVVYIPTKKVKNSTKDKNDKKENDEQEKVKENEEEKVEQKKVVKKEIIIKNVKIKGKKLIDNNKKNNENNVIVIEDDDDSPVEKIKSIDRKNKIIEETTNIIDNNKKDNEKNEIINELHIEESVYLDDTQLQLQYDSLYDDIFEVTLPNTLWGIHRDPERKLICITYFDITLLKTSKTILINDKYELKIYIFNHLLSEELTTELSPEILSCLINEIDEIKICKNAKQNTINDKCELKIENNDDDLCNVCKEK